MNQVRFYYHKNHEIKELVEHMTRYCICTHMLLEHFIDTKLPKIDGSSILYLRCKKCECNKFKEMSNMEWLAWQGSIHMPWYKRLYRRFVNKIK